MQLDDEIYKDLVATLHQEAAEQVERIGALLVELESGTSPERRSSLLDEAFRQAHNLKGAAGSLGFSLTAKLAHAIENVLAALRSAHDSELEASFDAVQAALEVLPDALAADPGAQGAPTVDGVLERLAELGGSEPTPARPQPVKPAATRLEPGQTEISQPRPSPKRTLVSGATASVRDDTLRVSMKKLGALMSQVGELLAARMRTDQRLAELRELLVNEEQLLERAAPLRALLRRQSGRATSAESSLQLADALRDSCDHQRELVRMLRVLVRGFESDALHSTILSGELQEDIRKIQTFPLSQVLEPLPRTVRNLARDAGKKVELSIEGAEIELDKKVLESLRDPLQHVLRNAVDHGIERPDLRKQAGKSPHGTIRVRAEHRGESVMITVSDDGPGVDFEAVRRRAIERAHLSTDQAAEFPEQRLVELLFSPGFTTRTAADRLSGRGVGLDVVRTNIEQLRGTVTLDSERGRGTTVTIILPLTIYVLHSLIVRVDSARYAIPISSVERILRLRPGDLLKVEQSDAVVVEGRPIAVVPLSSLLGLADGAGESHEYLTVIVVGVGDLRCALAVDEIVGDQTVLARNLEPPLVRVKNIGGATVLGDGGVVLMLNPLDLLRSAAVRETRRPLSAGAEPRVAPRLLLAEDSFTTRSLERSVLEFAGFEVVAVADGREALRALESDGPFDVIVTDVNMPQVSGFELCRKLRSDQRYRTLPVVLVTSLGSEQDRRTGLDVGADAYIVKSDFDHEALIATVNRLIGRAT